MADFPVFDGEGCMLGRYTVSERDWERLQNGGRLNVQYKHRPKFSHPALDAGDVCAFDLFLLPAGVVTRHRGEFLRMLELKREAQLV